MEKKEDPALAKRLLEVVPFLYKIFCQSSLPENHLPQTHIFALNSLIQYGELNMTQLSDLLDMPRQQLTKIINALVDSGLVIRRESEQNRRFIFIAISDSGRALIDQYLDLQSPPLVSAISTLDDEERLALARASSIFSKLILLENQKKDD